MVAAYNSSGLLNYHHVDWLGSYRLASTPSRAVYWDGAYAPFGEPYAQGGSSVDLSFTGQNALIGPEPGGPKERWKRNAEVAEPMANIDGIERELRMLRDNAKQFETEGTGGWRTLNAAGGAPLTRQDDFDFASGCRMLRFLKRAGLERPTHGTVFCGDPRSPSEHRACSGN